MGKCKNCDGNGEIKCDNPYYGDDPNEPLWVNEICVYCGGTGDDGR